MDWLAKRLEQGPRQSRNLLISRTPNIDKDIRPPKDGRMAFPIVLLPRLS